MTQIFTNWIDHNIHLCEFVQFVATKTARKANEKE